MELWKRKCVNPNSEDDECEKYTTVFQTTGIPLIIGLTLFAILAVIMFVIVRKNRRKRQAEEVAKHRDIDDGVELEFNVSQRKQGPYGQEQRTGSDLEDHFHAPPPKY
ncbi:hypothetical protein EDD36DRAFT_462465 [Exophiala viscosa]|uniref:Uncharacterized protein n=1 Tax=Exophiala viscosa TaxID=2486360 RepID=A0AAN6DZ57_9EURO|nr:hypothetical protein EDD36DRAFT_462465 [Exophiala viscosa]